MRFNLDQLIKKHGEVKTYEIGEYVFKDGEKDLNLYFLTDGEIILEKRGFMLFSLGAGQIIGEKSFLEKTYKPLDAKVVQKTKMYVLKPEVYEKMDENTKEEFLKKLVVYLSGRVNQLDELLYMINTMSDDIFNYAEKGNYSYLNDIMGRFIDLEAHIVLKNDNNEYQKIYGDLPYNQEIDSFVSEKRKGEVDIKIGKNYIYLNYGDYIFIFYGTPKISEYILHNFFLHSNAMMRYLGEKMEENKNKKLLANS